MEADRSPTVTADVVPVAKDRPRPAPLMWAGGRSDVTGPMSPVRCHPSPPRFTSCAAMTLRWISLVPSPTIIKGASRK